MQIAYLMHGKAFTFYIDEFEFRYNNRKNSYPFRDRLTRLVQATKLEDKELTA